MGNRRFTLVATSDDEDDGPPPPPPQRPSNSSNTEEDRTSLSKRKKMKLNGGEDDGEEEEEEVSREKKKARGRDREADVEKEEEEEVKEEEAAVLEDAKPIGEVTKVTGKGRSKRNHYNAFEYDGCRYELEDPVLLVPEETNQKPYVAIIKEISQQAKDGSMMVTGQWFYRPEEAEKRGGGNWLSRDTRELFYSFHRDEVPAESVMHKCVVHFIPLHKKIPNRKQHPGFIVQKVYDTEQRRLFKLTDKDYEDNKQGEIDLLVKKTMSRLGDLPDTETEDTAGQEEQLKNKRLLKKKSITPLDVSREDDATTRNGQMSRAETPGSCPSIASEYYNILVNFRVLTGETQRDKWLDKLLQAIQFIRSPAENGQTDDNEKGQTDGASASSETNFTKPANGSEARTMNGVMSFHWPDGAVPTIAALEKASHEALSADFQKYNQKMRQLTFNLRNNAQLARRLLNGELEPSKILSMSPKELKEGLTAEEIASREPEESRRMQMTDARCKRCTEKKVGLIDIIQAGLGDRYQLECIACGNTWYASRDEASTLTIDGPSSTRNVGTAPWATAKFEDVEKFVSPREPDKSSSDVFKKTTEAYMPVLDKQKSLTKSKTEDSNAATIAE